MAGTGVTADAYLFLPVPKRFWQEGELNESWASAQELAAIRASRKQGVVTRLYNPPDEHAPMLAYTGGRTAPALDTLAAAFASRWALDASAPPLLAVCTHGTRDRCCAKWGFAVFNRASALHASGASRFRPVQCSHLGGDRFAATGIVFPSGSMYGHLDEADLEALLGAEAAGRFLPSHYRGRVFEAPLTQVLRAGLARDSLADEAAAPLVASPQPDGKLRVETAHGAFLASVETAEVAFYPSCAKLAEGKLTRGRRTVYAGAVPAGPREG